MQISLRLFSVTHFEDNMLSPGLLESSTSVNIFFHPNLWVEISDGYNLMNPKRQSAKPCPNVADLGE